MLARALKEQLEQYPFNKISVRSICKACGMNRKSFYYHFKDKYDLLNWIFYNEFAACLQEGGNLNFSSFMEQLSRYLYQHQTFYRRAFDVRGQNSFCDYFQEFLVTVCSCALRPYWAEDQMFDKFAAFAADVTACAVRQWLQSEPPVLPEVFCHLLQASVVCLARCLGQGADAPAPPTQP